MPPNDRHVEVSLGFSFDDAGLTDAERAMAEFQRKASQMSGGGGSFDPFNPLAGLTGSPATAPPAFPAGGFPASGPNPQTSELIEALRDLIGGVQKETQERQSSNGLLSWLKANALLQMGGQVANQVGQGNIFSAAGTAAGAGLGFLVGGPAGMAAGASLGGGVGGFIQGLSTGAGDARDYEKFITDLNQRMGLGDVSRFRNYRQGEQFGYTAEDSADLTERLRGNRALTDPAQAGGLVSAVQQLTRTLGLNVEQTAELVGTYTQTGGARGGGAARDYLASVVGGAVEAGMETSLERYADIMGSARMRQVQATGAGVSDQAFGLLQDVFASLTTGGSQTSRLFNANTQLAGGALQTMLGMGGTADPFSSSAAFMRLAGIREENLDLRFNDTGQIAANAGRSISFLGDRLQGVSGLSESEYQRRAASDPNFVRGLIGGNAGLQRFTSQMVSGFLGRDASATDLRAYEELANIAAANGGQLPMDGSTPGGGRAQALMQQLQSSPADEMRQREAERHNATIEAMSNFMNLQTKVDEWMTSLYEWMTNNINLKGIESTILAAMSAAEKAAAALSKWADDNNIVGVVSEYMERFLAIADGALGVAGAAGGVAGGMARHPMTQFGLRHGIPHAARMLAPGPSLGLQMFRNFFGGADADDEFNDTPGGVVAQPGYNTFRFAPGDIVTARSNAVPGGVSLKDISMVLMDQTGSIREGDNTLAEQGKAKLGFQEQALQVSRLILNSADYRNQALDNVHGVLQGLLPEISAGIQSVRSEIAGFVSSISGAGGGGGGGGGSGVAQFPLPGVTLGSANITSGFGWRNIFGRRDFHEGLDFAAKGGTPVLAARSGTVSQIKPLADQLQIAIQSVDEQGRQLEEWYIHTADALVEVGDSVTAGQQIASISSTSNRARAARVSTGDHLDYRVRRDGEWVNPRELLRGLPAGGARSGGGGLSLPGQYSALQELGGTLSASDPRFGDTPEGRATLALALAIGGSETHGAGWRGAEMFTGRGGAGNNMLGFAQYNLAYHSSAVDTPGEYVDFTADILTGQRALPNGRRGRNFGQGLQQAISSGQVKSGADMERWMRSQGLGGSNWQGVDDGFGRVPGLTDSLVEFVRGSGPQARGGTVNHIAVNVSIPDGANAGVAREAAQAGTMAALDEFEQRRQANPNPRNSSSLSPVYG